MVWWIKRKISHGRWKGCELVGLIPVKSMLRSLFGVIHQWIEQVREGGWLLLAKDMGT